MIEYNKLPPTQPANEEFFEQNRVVGVQNNEGKLSLTQLWEVIIKKKRLPDGFDINVLYAGLRDKLRDPEREVRQHALRFLVDLIPITQTLALDEQMRALVPEVLANLSHSAPALRKSALDSLRKYLRHSNNSDELLMELVSSEEDSIIGALPFLISKDTSDHILSKVIDHLWEDLNNPRLNQEGVAKSLARIRFILGDERFKILIGFDKFEELCNICNKYGLPIDYSDGESDLDKTVLSDNGDMEDRVILETEITLKTGPAITMKIHEQSRSNSISDGASDSDEVRPKTGVIKVLEDDSENDFYESSRRTPRKVRFGGECVKMRTPESDSSNQEDEGGEIRITVTDAISIKTRKSLIPIRITSLPSTPRKGLTVVKNRLHKSTPNLSLTGRKSKIPLKRNSSVWLNVSSGAEKRKGSPRKSSDSTNPLSKLTLEPVAKKPNKSDAPSSPIPVHNEIEIIHNLTRSPERKRRPSVDPDNIFEKEKLEDESMQISYDSFQICPQPSPLTLPVPNLEAKRLDMNKDIKRIEKGDDSFKECPEDQRIVGLSSPVPPNIKKEHETESNEQFDSFQVYNEIKEAPIAPSNNGKIELQSYPENGNFNSFQVYPQGQQSMVPQPMSLPICDSSSKDTGVGQVDISNNNLPEDPRVVQNCSNGQVSNKKQKEESLFTGSILGGYWERNLDMPMTSTEENFWNKSEALDNLIKMLKQPNTLESLEPGPASLLFEALFACQNLDKLHFLADDALELMVEGIRLNVLEQCLGRLALGICKIGAPSGVSLALLVMKKCPAKKLQLEIIDRCQSHRTREGALQVLMAAARLLPSIEVEVTKVTEFAAGALRDRRKRVRHAALETLATLAQLGSNLEVMEIVSRVTSNSQDHQHLMRVVRTRLSRRQLPTVDVDGTIRYSTPREQTELEWLAGSNVSSSPSSSASSSNNSVNYWRHNSRHEEDDGLDYVTQANPDDSANGGNQQIWAIDPSVLPKVVNGKNSGKGPPVFRPVYILQPDAASLSRARGRGFRRYDRGRSFSPPKRDRRPYQEAAEAPGAVGSAQQFSAAASDQHYPVAGSAPQFSHVSNFQRKFRYSEGFRKSFSSEQLYVSERPMAQENYYSLSSRSSTTSTGSSSRSGVWHRDMRSGIPIPISSEMKLRLRTNNSTNTTGPVIARRNRKVSDVNGSLASHKSTPVLAITLPPEPSEKSVLNSPIESPIISRISPRENGHVEPVPQNIPLPPQSSGSESSGYFTPPPQAFVKLDTEEHLSESDDLDGHDKNNNSDFVDSFNNNSEFFVDNNLQGIEAASSGEISDPSEEINEIKIESLSLKSILSDKDATKSIRFSASSLKEPSFSGNVSPTMEIRSKSKSEVDLQNFLPDIVSTRKNTNSAPLLKDDSISNDNIIITNLDDSPILARNNLIETEQPLEMIATETEVTVTRKLSRRLSRTQSRKSIRCTPRSVPVTTPKSSRSTNKPKDNLQHALTQLNNPEWEVMIQGLQSLTRIVRHQPDIIEAQIHTVCINLARHIKNLRSQVARVACHTAAELFTSCRRGLDIELEEIAGPLLHRTADTNKFLRADANEALDIMCEHLPLHRVISVINARGCRHQNAVVRSTSIRLIKDLVKRLGADKVFQIQKEIRDKILQAGANALTDGSPEARGHGKAMFSCLVGHPSFQRTLLEVVPQSTLRNIAKTLATIKPCKT